MAIEQVRALAARAANGLTTGDDPVLAAEPVSPHHVDLPTPVAPDRNDRLRSQIILGAIVLLGLIGALVVVGTSPDYVMAPPVSWRFTVPFLRPGYGASSWYFGATFLIGVLALGAGWLLLMGHLGRSVASEKRKLIAVFVATGIWAAPFLAGPIQGSSDAYSYAAQGYMATIGIDPSAHGPEAIPNHSSNEFWQAADVIWRKSPAPYGPVAVAANKVAVILSGDDVTRSVFFIRFAAAIGVAMMGVGVYLIAVKRRVSPAVALVIAIANPVVLLHLIGGGHNDAVMAGLLCLGLAAWERSRKWLAVVLVCLAIMVKLPAILALGLIAWNWSGAEADWKRRLRDLPVVGAVFAALVGVGCLAIGIGFGWITALSSTGSVYSTFSPSTKLGFILADLLNVIGIDVNALTMVGVTRAIGLLVAGAIFGLVLIRSPRMGVTRATGIALLTLMLAGPVIWPWYLPVGFALLAASGVRKLRPSMIVLIMASSLLVWPASVNAVVPLSRYQHWLGLLVVAIITGCCLGAQYMARSSDRRRLRGGTNVPRIDDVLIGPGAPAPVATTATATAAGSDAAAELVG